MGKYALIKNGLVVNVVMAELEFVESLVISGSIDEAVDLLEHPEFPVSPGQAFNGEDFELYPSLAQAIADRLASFQSEALLYVDQRYSDRTVRTFHTLWAIAVEDGLTNQKTYIKKLLTWSKSVAAYSAKIIAQIQAAPTVEAVVGITWDFDANVLPDPKIKVAIALQIMD